MAWLGGAVCVFAIAFLSQPSPASPSPPCRGKLIDQRDHVSELFVQAFDGQLLPNLFGILDLVPTLPIFEGKFRSNFTGLPVLQRLSLASRGEIETLRQQERRWRRKKCR